MIKPNLVFLLGFVQNQEKIGKSKVLREKYEKKRKFYSCNQEFNHMKYVNKVCKEKINYVAYSGNDEKSQGIFGKNGVMSRVELKKLKEDLQVTKSVIWHGVLSFSGEFGEKYLKDNSVAINLMQKEFVKFFKNAGLKADNTEWYAALHQNTMNKHIHFSFFEKEPTKYTSRDSNNLHFSQGRISKVAIDKFKVCIEQRLINMSNDIKNERKIIIDLAKSVLFSPNKELKHLGKVQKGMVELLEQLPATGRLSYDSKNMTHLKPKINSIVDNIILSNKQINVAFNNLVKAIVGKDFATKEILKSQRIDEKFWKHYLVEDKILQDIYRRLGNYVVNVAVVFRNRQKNVTSKLVKKRYKKQTMVGVLDYCLKLSSHMEMYILNAFEEYIEKLKEMEKEQREMNFEQY